MKCVFRRNAFNFGRSGMVVHTKKTCKLLENTVNMLSKRLGDVRKKFGGKNVANMTPFKDI